MHLPVIHPQLLSLLKETADKEKDNAKGHFQCRIKAKRQQNHADFPICNESLRNTAILAVVT